MKLRQEREEEFNNKLAALPDVWEGIALPYKNETGYLDNSSFLWENREKVKISIERFVDSAVDSSCPPVA